MSYKNGFGIEKNLEMSIKHFIIAAEQGHGNSMLELFIMAKDDVAIEKYISIERVYKYTL